MLKLLFRNLFKENSLVFKLVSKIYTYWYPKFCDFDVLKAYANYKTEIHFIQIGSNDGITGDPLYSYISKHSWKGVLVEPVPYLFSELLINYKDLSNGLKFENSAIASQSGDLQFYRLQKSNLPDLPIWYEQLGSFRKEVILRHRDAIPHFDELFIEDKVYAITFSDLIKKHSIKKIELIHIDTEGFDFEILKLIPFSDFDIEIVMFEHVHLSNMQYKQSLALLKKRGFISRRSNTDTIAVQRKLIRLLKSASNQHG